MTALQQLMQGLALTCVVSASAATVLQASTISRIRETKLLRCGVNAETPEYSTSDDHGPRAAFDADLCKAVAVAILGRDAHTSLIEYPDDITSMDALRSGKVDLIPTLTLDISHAAGTNISFTRPILYDGVGFLVPVGGPVTTARTLDGQKVCFLAETEVEVALRAWFALRHLKFLPFPFQEEGEMEAAFVTGNCAALAGDLTRLATTRLGFGTRAVRYTLLPDQISKDPLAAAFRPDDASLADVVRWTLEVLIQAEESGISQKNIAVELPRTDPAYHFLTGHTREIGTLLSLDQKWAAEVISAVGNYGEIYERDLGRGSALGLPRALNRLYTDDGLMYAIPLKKPGPAPIASLPRSLTLEVARRVPFKTREIPCRSKRRAVSSVG